MRRALFIYAIALLLLSTTALAQDVQNEGNNLSYEELMLELGERVVSTNSVDKAMGEHINKNPMRGITGYRLRIFFDNKQDARGVSEKVVLEFSEKYPNVPVYRVYSNPYFKVTVGDFRTKSDALKFMQEIKEFYPSVFLVKETFSTNGV